MSYPLLNFPLLTLQAPKFLILILPTCHNQNTWLVLREFKILTSAKESLLLNRSRSGLHLVWLWGLICAQVTVVLKEALSVLMLCTHVFIFTSGSSALLGCPCCGLSIWLSLLAIFNTLFWVLCQFFSWENGQENKKILEVHHFCMISKWPPTVIRRTKH